MELNQALIAEIKMEAANTRKILANVPFDQWDFKPHERSMTIGRLATHIAELNGWVIETMSRDGLDFATMEYKPATVTNTDELVALLDSKVEGAISALESSTNEDFGKMWTLSNGEKVHFTLPKAAVVRSFALSHLYHHRGQLSVYLRLLDVHVPGMYGPSKDEEIAMKEAAAAALVN